MAAYNINNVSVGARGKLFILFPPSSAISPASSQRNQVAACELPSIISALALESSDKSTVCSPASVKSQKTTLVADEIDQAEEMITICLSRARPTGTSQSDWLLVTAKFHTDVDDDWISEDLATCLGFPTKVTQVLKCKGFDSKVFYSERIVDRLTWISEKVQKSICGHFRLMPNAPYDILIGKKTIADRKLFSLDYSSCNLGTLVTKRISRKTLETRKANPETCNTTMFC